VAAPERRARVSRRAPADTPRGHVALTDSRLKGATTRGASVAHEPTLLDPTLGAPGAARDVVRAFLSEERLDFFCDDALLLTSELVTNSVVHAEGPISLGLAREGSVLRVEVGDHTTCSITVPAASSDTGGRGLMLLDALADRWGAEPTSEGKVVWFELRVR